MVTYDSSESAQAAVKLDRSIISGNSRFVESFLQSGRDRMWGRGSHFWVRQGRGGTGWWLEDVGMSYIFKPVPPQTLFGIPTCCMYLLFYVPRGEIQGLRPSSSLFRSDRSFHGPGSQGFASETVRACMPAVWRQMSEC